MDNGASIIFKLTDARRRKLPWYDLAKHVRDLERSSLLDPSGRPWLKIAAEVSGYAANHIRRFQAVLRFVEGLVEQGQLKAVADIGSLPF